MQSMTVRGACQADRLIRVSRVEMLTASEWKGRYGAVTIEPPVLG